MKRITISLLFFISFFLPIRSESLSSTDNYFIKNQGQWASEIAFASKGNNINLSICNDAIYYDFKNGKNGEVLRIEFENALNARIVGVSELLGKYNFFFGNSPDKWLSNVPIYKSIKLSNVYPGIDVLIHYDMGCPRYDFIILPGAEPKKIKMKISGANSLILNNNELLINGLLGQYRHKQLFAYQDYNGIRHRINCNFSIENNIISFNTGKYNKQYSLIIDPIVFSDYIGGNNIDGINDVKALNGGYIVTAGYSSSSDFKTTSGVYDTLNKGGTDIIIKKYRVENEKREMIFATYIGGGLDDIANGLALDKDGNIYLTGQTKSTDLPIIKSFGTIASGKNDAFFIRLSADGSKLLNCSYLGGSSEDIGTDIAINPQNGSVAICGYTNSRNFPIKGSADQGTIGGLYDAFITKLRPSHTSIEFSTYWGGTNNDKAWAIAQDNSSLFVGGETDGNFPIKPHRVWLGQTVDKPIDALYNGGYDGFAIKMDAHGSGVEFSTYFGGKSDDRVTAVAFFNDGTMLIGGETKKESSTKTFMTSDNAYQTRHNGNLDCFVAHLGSIKIKQPFNQKYQELIFSTFFGGSGNDSLRDIAFNEKFNAIYITGNTNSRNFPTKGENVDTKIMGKFDAYAAKLLVQGNDLLWATLFGGSEFDVATSCDVDSMYNLIIAGITESNDIIPDIKNFQGEYAGGASDGFLTKYVIGSLKIKYPIPAEMVCAGSHLDIQYDIKGLTKDEPFTIDYSLAKDSAWHNITNEAKNGQYRWDIPIFNKPYDSVRIRMTHKNGLCDTSGYFKILTPAHISGQTYYPESREVCEGDTILIYTQIEGSELTYQWYLNSEKIPGQTSQDLFVPNATLENNGKYKLMVTSLCKPNATSTEIEFKVNPATHITKQPANIEAKKGDDIRFTVKSNGLNLNYEWQRNGQKILGANNDNYSIKSVQKGNEGEYRCIVTGDCGVDTSKVAILKVNDQSAVNDERLISGLNLSILSINSNYLRFAVINSRSSFVKINIYDLFGREVKNVFSDYMKDRKELVIQFDNINSGIYFLNITNGTQSIQRKIIITK